MAPTLPFASIVPVPAMVLPPVSSASVSLAMTPSAYIMPADGPPMSSTCIDTFTPETSMPLPLRYESAALVADDWDESISWEDSSAYSSLVCPTGNTTSCGITVCFGSSHATSA